MSTHPYIAKIAARECYERKLQDADEWRLSQTLRKNRSGTPLRAAYRALCRLGARLAASEVERTALEVRYL